MFSGRTSYNDEVALTRSVKKNLMEIPTDSTTSHERLRETPATFNRDQVVEFKRWLCTQVRFIATAAEVVAFNRLFKEVRFRRGTKTAQ